MIQLNGIEFGFGGRLLMEDLSLHIKPQDRLGIVGPNGAGKTTLLRIILGDIECDQGTISRRKTLRVGLLPQEGIYDQGRTVFDAAAEPFAHLLETEQKIELLHADAAHADEARQHELVHLAGELQQEYEMNDGFTCRARISEILLGLGFTEEDFTREVGTLSGGWQMRIALARLLLLSPDIVLLDEPTNHLDLPALEWFENFLRSFPGAVAVISHDRYFLDRVVTRVVEFQQRKLELYTGNYSDYEIEKEKRLEILMGRIARQDREIKETEKFIERFRYKATKARQVQSRIKALDKVDRLEAPSKTRELKFHFKAATRSGRVVMQLDGVNKSYGEKRVLTNVNMTINRGDRIGIIGANGLGKSTLIRVLSDRTEFEGERRLGHNVQISYFSQDQFELLTPDNTVLEEASSSCAPEFNSKVRSVLGVFLFSGNDAEKRVRNLSGGEKSRLLLAKIMLQPCNFILLDEPTNHLDPSSRDMLELVLATYDGTICFVSHDRLFINGLSTRIVEITPTGINEYIGNYEDYLEQRTARKRGSLEAVLPDNTKSNPTGKQKKEDKRERAKFVGERSRALAPLRKTVEDAEENVHRLESRLAEIETELADPANHADANKMRELPMEMKSVKEKLDEAMAKWETLSEEFAEKKKAYEG